MGRPRGGKRWWCGDEPGSTLNIRGRESVGYFRVSLNPDEQEQHSINEQETEYGQWTPRVGVIASVENYADDDRSASGYATKLREDFAQLRNDIAAGKHDGKLLWFWSTSRQTRGDIPLDTLAAESVMHGIVWVFSSNVCNPANSDDMMVAGINYIMDKALSDRIKKDVRRAKKAGAHAGRPAGVVLYGYKRNYQTDSTGQPVLIKGRPRILGDQPNELDENDIAIAGTSAWVVRLIFDRLEHGDSIAGIRAWLDEHRIPTPHRPVSCTTCGEKTIVKGRAYGCPRGHEIDMCRWNSSTVRFIAMNPGYIGRRIFQADSWRPQDRRKAILDGVETMWPALITEEQFWTVQNVLAEAGRDRWRGGEPRGNPGHLGIDGYLLTKTARCANCGASMGGHFEKGQHWYKCGTRGCTTIRADWLDAYAEDRLVSWMVLPEVRTQIFGSREEDDERISGVRAKLAKMNGELEDTIRMGESGEMPPVMAARIGRSLADRIAEAEEEIRNVPAGKLYDMLGPDAADRWVALKTSNLPAARQLLASVASIYVHPAKRRGGVVNKLDEDRAEWHWAVGPDASSTPTRKGYVETRADRVQALAAAREHAAELLTTDPTQPDSAIGAKAGCSYGTVKRIRGELVEAGTITEPGYRVSKDGSKSSATRRRRPARETEQLIADMLQANPSIADKVICAQIGCHWKTVAKIRSGLTEAGTITDPGYRVGHKGTRLTAARHA